MRVTQLHGRSFLDGAAREGRSPEEMRTPWDRSTPSWQPLGSPSASTKPVTILHPKALLVQHGLLPVPARLTLGLSYRSSLKLAAPVSCHINCEPRSRTYVMSYQSQGTKAPQVGVLAPAASLPKSSGCLRNDRSPLCVGSGSAGVEIRCANAAELGSLTGAAANLCIQTVSKPDARDSLHREIDECPQQKVNGFADRCCDREFFFFFSKEASYSCPASLDTSVNYCPNLSCRRSLIL